VMMATLPCSVDMMPPIFSSLDGFHT